MDLETLEVVKNLPLFRQEKKEQTKIEGKETEVRMIPIDEEKKSLEIVPLDKEKKSRFLINYGEQKYLLNIDKEGAKKELDVWLILTEKGLEKYRPNLYYIDPNFDFTISHFYEGYTSIDQLDLSMMDKEMISMYLLQLNKDFHTVQSNEFNLREIIQNEFVYGISVCHGDGVLSEEEAGTILSFINRVDFGKVATYNHQEIAMENILYNKETKDTKVIHMEQARYGVPIYDYLYMLKTLDEDISRVFLPELKESDPQVIQIISLLCDINIYCKNRDKGMHVDMNLQDIHDQVSALQTQMTTLRNK